MVRLFFLDTEGSADILSKKAEEKTAFPDKTYEEMLLSQLPDNLRAKIEGTNNTELRADRILTYTLLARAVLTDAPRIYSKGDLTKKDRQKNAPSLIFDEGGKPRLSDSDFGISLSHTENISLVAIASQRYADVGIDVELINGRAASVATRFISRYAPDFDIRIGNLCERYEKSGRENIFIFTLEDGNICKECNSELVFENGLTLADLSVLRWCATEAILKAEGGGFASLTRLKEISEGFTVCGGIISYKQRRYAVAFAEEKL
ncbi:MAG: hypothetical protein IKD45_01350 [Clostridia bacterium]|nr:hypothetical protein [Clostridia bacterium]